MRTPPLIRLLTRHSRLKESEAKFRLLFERAVDAIFVHTLDGRFVDVNQAACDSVGYSREELLAMSVFDIEVAIGPPLLTRLWSELAVGQVMTFNGEQRRQDGSIISVEIHLSSFVDRGETLIFASSRNITARLNAEHQLRESEARFRAIVENSHDGIIFADRRGGIVYRSPSFQDITGYSDRERNGRSAFETIHPDDLPEVQAKWKELIAIPGGNSRAEFRIRHKDGTWRWIDTAMRNLLGNPNVHAVVVTSRDVTERKRAEAERENLQTQLAQAQKIEAVGRLAGGVAHDFNNMLSVILGFVELAIESTGPDHPMRQDLHEIRRAAERSSCLTRQLLAFARQQPVTPRVIDLNETVQEMLSMLRRLIGENIALQWLPGAELAHINIDPTQVDQILANLCVNARDAISGVGTLCIETSNAVLDARYCATHPGAVQGSYVCLNVSDTGCGMSPEVLAHIFEPFYTTKGVGKGTGLGLATVYGVVKQNSGYIEVNSQVGRGSCFSIYLPACHVDATRLQSARGRSVASAGTGTVLLVEDEAAVLALTKRVLEHLGYSVIAASSPTGALDLAAGRAGNIDLLMTDVIMPEMNGRQLAERLHEQWPGIRCLFTSGYTADVIADHGVLDGGVHFLKKPWTKDELATKVREVLVQVQPRAAGTTTPSTAA